ncbi:MAG TPA: non-homologous end-joining DNA ligase [Candidatus Dormibacteraeota bacterium]|nr:non-homologous end-joining DNA ligase [Candidatus Dormibacteraeota bacterium]
MAAKSTSVEVQIEGRTLKLSNLDKILYPEVGFAKAQVVDYYTRIAPLLLPHLKNRPLTLKRYPNGVTEEFFYEKNCPKHRPDWVHTASIWSGGNARYMDYCTVDDLPSLVWVANLATLELHTSLSLGDDIERPRHLVFDLDPGPPATIVDCARVGLWVKEIFDSFGMESFAKTSGSKGLQLYVPLNGETNYEETKTVSYAIATTLAEQHPEHVVSLMRKDLRTNKVFIDWSQNDASKTTINVYSLRARENPSVSTPLTWDEVSDLLESGDPARSVFQAPELLARVEKLGDLFSPLLTLQQRLPDALVGAEGPTRRSAQARARSGLRRAQP